MALSDRVVVMHGGRILQVGSPEDIYSRPDSRQVAAFFGAPNLLDAEVRGCRRNGAATYVLEVSGPGLAGECQAAAEVAAGSRITIMLRPENLLVAAAPDMG